MTCLEDLEQCTNDEDCCGEMVCEQSFLGSRCRDFTGGVFLGCLESTASCTHDRECCDGSVCMPSEQHGKRCESCLTWRMDCSYSPDSCCEELSCSYNPITQRSECSYISFEQERPDSDNTNDFTSEIISQERPQQLQKSSEREVLNYVHDFTSGSIRLTTREELYTRENNEESKKNIDGW